MVKFQLVSHYNGAIILPACSVKQSKQLNPLKYNLNIAPLNVSSKILFINNFHFIRGEQKLKCRAPPQLLKLFSCLYTRSPNSNEQSPDALASGLWNGEFGGDLLSHG